PEKHRSERADHAAHDELEALREEQPEAHAEEHRPEQRDHGYSVPHRILGLHQGFYTVIVTLPTPVCLGVVLGAPRGPTSRPQKRSSLSGEGNLSQCLGLSHDGLGAGVFPWVLMAVS